MSKYPDPQRALAPQEQLVLFRAWGEAVPADVVDVESRDPNPVEPGVVRALERRALWGRVAGLLTGGRVSWREAAEVGLREVADGYAGNQGTQTKAVHELARFVRYVSGCGVEWVDEVERHHVDEFVWWASKRYGQWTDVKATTAANRQSFVRRFMQTLTEMGLWTGGDIVGAAIPRDIAETSRLLSESELHRVHINADTGLFRTRRASLVVLAESGADAAETATVTIDDVDLVGRTVRLGVTEQRVNPLSDWAHATLVEILANQPVAPCEPLCVSRGLSLNRAAHSVTVRLREVLADAGLAGVPRVTARSIRLTAAARVLGAEGIEAAARFLGNDSLDATARSLGHDWWVR